MPKKDLSRALSEVTFHCRPCSYTFKAQPGRIQDAPEQSHHPYQYFAECRQCGDEVPQAQHERSLLKAWANATGPRTPEGKAAAAANLEGHPTAEEALRTRFNGMKHGLTAQVATYFPARPGKYGRCNGCDVDWGHCATQPACVKQTEQFMLHHAAFEQRDPKHLIGLHANMQAAIFSVLQDILQTIIGDGVKISNPAWSLDKEGNVVVAEYSDSVTGQRHVIQEIHAHPLFKPLSELLSRNNLSLSDMGMTMKDVTEETEERGRLVENAQTRELASDFMRAQAASMDALRDMLQRSKIRADSDPILIEHTQQNGEG